MPAGYRGWVVIDEIQRLPDLLNEVHRLIEARRLRFVLTGSSARKLRRKGVNLLAGRALTRFMHPLTATELGRTSTCVDRSSTAPCPPRSRNRIRGRPQELRPDLPARGGPAGGLLQEHRRVRPVPRSGKLLPGLVLNMADVARDCPVGAKVVEDYFAILEDLLLAFAFPCSRNGPSAVSPRTPSSTSSTWACSPPCAPRPAGRPEEIRGAALETLFLQHLRAVNDYLGLDYSLHYWRTAAGDEVDFVLYGGRGLIAFEVTTSPRVRPDDLRGLLRLREDYPQARAFFVYTGSRRWHERGVHIVPADEALRNLRDLIR